MWVKSRTLFAQNLPFYKTASNAIKASKKLAEAVSSLTLALRETFVPGERKVLYGREAKICDSQKNHFVKGWESTVVYEREKFCSLFMPCFCSA